MDHGLLTTNSLQRNYEPCYHRRLHRRIVSRHAAEYRDHSPAARARDGWLAALHALRPAAGVVAGAAGARLAGSGRARALLRAPAELAVSTCRAAGRRLADGLLSALRLRRRLLLPGLRQRGAAGNRRDRLAAPLDLHLRDSRLGPGCAA